MTMLETCCFIGLLLPAEATILLASFLASQGLFAVEHVLLATLAGGFLGDQIGYGLGRFGGDRASGSDSRVGRLWRRNEVRAHSLFRRQSLLAISAARFVSFVRTLMPWLAGMSKMRYRRFVLYDAIGVTGWACASVALGYYAGESMDAIAEILGVASVVILAVAAVMIYTVFKKRRGSRASRATYETAARSLYRVGLTGNIGSGKSTVADVWRKLGAKIIDADDLARRAVEPNTHALAAIRARFGNSVLEPWGDLDRAALRNVVFNDATARKDLEAIVHPEVERLRTDEERRLSNAHEAVVVHMIPLLFENNMEELFDEIVFVDAAPDIREKRIMDARGLTAEEARAMMSSQMSADEKRDRVDHIVENDGSVEELEERAAQIWRGIMERACE
jgi:dephospho-CoA kinase